LGYGALLVGLLVTALFCFLRTAEDGQAPPEHFGWLRDQSATLLPLFSLLMTETLHFLESGDITGCTSIMLLAPFMWVVPRDLYGNDWVWQGLRFPNKEPGVFLLVVMLAWVLLLACAAGPGPRVRSTSPLYRLPHGVANQPAFRMLRVYNQASLWFRTWRGANVVYLTNGLFSFIGYMAVRHSLLENMREALHDQYADEQGIWYTGEPIVDLTVGLSALSVFVAALNLTADMLVGDRISRWSEVSAWMPTDRHFRMLTLCKATMLWLKVELLMFTCFECKEDVASFGGSSIVLVSFQILSVLATSMVACLSMVSLSTVASVYAGFHDEYQRPRLLWCVLAIAMLAINAVSCVMMVCKALGDASPLIRVVQQYGCVGILLNLGQTYYYPFFCMANEAVLSISSKASNPRVFQGLDSARGVHALSVYCAAKFPMEILVNCVECQFLLPSYMKHVFTFSRSWVGPMFGYTTVFLIVASFVIYIACGADGVEVRRAPGGTQGVIEKADPDHGSAERDLREPEA